MPGPSFAPIFAAVGAFLLFLGVVFGGLTLVLGAIGLAIGLLYWLREGIVLYERDVERTQPQLPAVVHEGPPEGVHMPGPSFRPLIASLGAALLLAGLVFGPWLLAAGIIALTIALLGWLTRRDRGIPEGRGGRRNRPSREPARSADAVGGPRGVRRPGRRGRAAPDRCVAARPGRRR